jgi:flagellar biosynthesis/type III secretory pathway chaperone
MTKPIHAPDLEAKPPYESARLNALVDEASLLMDQLGAISADQHQAVESGDVAQIVEIVSKREPIIRGLVCVGEEIEAFINNPQAIASVGKDVCADALDRIARIEHAMKKLREHDAQDQKRMESTRDTLAEQLGTMGKGKKALRAYTSRTSTPNPILQDRQG